MYDYNDMPSNFRYTKTLSELLEENGIPGISGVDTRKLTRSIRDLGSRRVLITSPDIPAEVAVEIIKNTPVAHDAVSRVSCKKRWYSRTSNPQFNVVAIDCGMKLNIVRSLNKFGCNVVVVPYDTPADEIEFMKPDGVFLSNGPGDPEDVTPVINTVRALRGKYPIFGICLGHQMISLAYGAKTYKLKFGHRGGNHPVMNLDTNKITPNGGLTEGEAKAMGMHANQLAPLDLKSTMKVATAGVTGVDPMTSVHVRNWMECIRSGEKTNAPVEAAYDHSSACIMVNAALRTKQYVTFDEEHQEVLAGGKVFKF